MSKKQYYEKEIIYVFVMKYIMQSLDVLFVNICHITVDCFEIK